MLKNLQAESLNLKAWWVNPLAFAYRASPGFGLPFAFFEGKTAFDAVRRGNHELLALTDDTPLDMWQMIIDLLFPNTDLTGYHF